MKGLPTPAMMQVALLGQRIGNYAVRNSSKAECTVLAGLAESKLRADKSRW
jgi:hypothetical protein